RQGAPERATEERDRTAQPLSFGGASRALCIDPGRPGINMSVKGADMYPTKNDLPETTRRQMIDLCNARLADAIDLQTQTKQAHWNVKGPHFIALHELFDKVNEDVDDLVDLVDGPPVHVG